MRQLLSLLSIMAATAAAAQSPDTALIAGHKVLGEVEVTGIKRTVRSDAAAITNITPAMISRLGIDAVKDIGEIAPNFYMPDYGSPITSAMYVRGLGARMDQPVVGLQVDGVQYLNKDAYDFDIADIANIEVVRGAQATLNGRNSMGGRIIVSTLSPWHFNGWRVHAEGGSFRRWRGGAGWYGKLSPTVATSVAATGSGHGGYWVNAATGEATGKNRRAEARWKLSWRPTSYLSVTNTAAASHVRQYGYPYVLQGNAAPAYNDTCDYRRWMFSDGLTASFAGKRMIVTSTTSLQYIDDVMRLDQDFSPLPYFTLRQARREWSFAEDIYAKGSRGRYDWLLGAFAFSRSASMDAPVRFGPEGVEQLIEKHRNEINPEYPIEWFSRSFTLGSEFKPGSWGFALYHQGTVRLGQWAVDLGLRWDVERVRLSYHSFCNTGYNTWHMLPDGQRVLYSTTPVVIDDADALHRTYQQLLPKLTLTRRFANGRAWLDVSKAYKAGGYNTQMFSDVLQQRIMGIMGLTAKYTLDQIVSYRPERSWNYELGTSLSWPAQRLNVEAVAFVIDCRDQQLTVFPDGNTTGRIMTNAGRTLSAGAELSARWSPTTQLDLQAAWGFTHARFVKFHNGLADYAGKRVPFAPANTLFASAVWKPAFTVFGLRPQLGTQLRCAGDIYFDEANTVRQPLYALLGVNLTLNAEHWSLRLWAENLTDTRYDTFYFRSMSRNFAQPGAPRTLGAAVKVNI